MDTKVKLTEKFSMYHLGAFQWLTNAEYGDTYWSFLGIANFVRQMANR